MSLPNPAPYPPYSNPPPTPPRRSPRPWVGIGCGVVALLLACLFLVFALVFLGGLATYSATS